MVDSTGAISSQANYDSFGNQTNSNFASRYQFTGREFDSFSGLYYYRARWYDSQLGRFISEDPIGFAAGDVNLFAYVGNNPVRFYDPLGLDDADIAFRNTDQYRELERSGNEFWDLVKKLKKPECGPAGQPIIEFLVPDTVGGPLGPFGDKYNLTPTCETHDSCYSTCGASKEQCDAQLKDGVKNTCLQGGGSEWGCSFYGNAYYQGVSRFGDGAYKSAQEQSGCVQCSLPLPRAPRVPCSSFGDWRCK